MAERRTTNDERRVWPAIASLAKQVQTGEVSALENVEQSLKIIADKNPEYQAIIVTIEERAKQRAKEIDERIKNGEDVGRLAGVPFIAKDNFLVFGADTTAASNILKGFDAPYQSTAVNRLEAEGAICVAKANLDALAHGASTKNSDYYVTKNPYDPSRVAGGSSGGSAAAVALDMAPFSIGTDTGGSIRQPSSFCGVVGYKPTYGLVSRSGVVAMASSTDTIGAMTTNVADNALVMDVMAGLDELDGTTIERDPKPYTATTVDLKGKKIGVIKEYCGEGLDPGVKERVTASIDALKQAGADVQDISLPSTEVALAVYYIIVPAELSSNLARHDGQRFQYSAPDAENLEQSYIKTRTTGFGAEAKRRIMIGTHVLSSGYYDAYYNKALTVRTKLINEFANAFESFDFLIGPVSPTPAFKIDENDDPLQMYLQDVMTAASNLVGFPAVSIPAGETSGLPVGVQLMAPIGRDGDLLGAAASLEELLR